MTPLLFPFFSRGHPPFPPRMNWLNFFADPPHFPYFQSSVLGPDVFFFFQTAEYPDVVSRFPLRNKWPSFSWGFFCVPYPSLAPGCFPPPPPPPMFFFLTGPPVFSRAIGHDVNPFFLFRPGRAAGQLLEAFFPFFLRLPQVTCHDSVPRFFPYRIHIEKVPSLFL